MSYRYRRHTTPSEPQPPPWNKEKIHAKMEHERRLLEAGKMDYTPQGPFWPFNLIGGLLVVIAIGLAIFGVTQVIKLRAGDEWHRVIASVTSIYIEHQTDSKNKSTYSIMGTYTYTVKGHAFHFNAQQGAYNDANLANAKASSFIGSRTDVYYNPISPGQVASFPVVVVSTAASFGGAIILIFLSIFFFARGTPRSR